MWMILRIREAFIHPSTHSALALGFPHLHSPYYKNNSIQFLLYLFRSCGEMSRPAYTSVYQYGGIVTGRGTDS